jgi:hypothetical protein
MINFQNISKKWLAAAVVMAVINIAGLIVFIDDIFKMLAVGLVGVIDFAVYYFITKKIMVQ